ncbi:MAG: dTDP-4-dehydrorhamnose 3,5-epimerase [Anaerolineae bacterium]|nr:dTDP-4-dehydrorhamnose 3,5-epimerase [Anaerolineae bacterium]
MEFAATNIADAFVIDIKKFEDHRGFFARGWCLNTFADHGIHFTPVQANIGFSAKKGTLRGLHYQAAPHQEAKLIRCVKGAVFDVIVDVRPESATYKQWFGLELSADNYTMLYIPEGCAHGYLSLQDNSEVFYQVSQFYAPGFEQGIRWDDPTFAIDWPIQENLIISDKDQNWPAFAG